MFSQKLVFMTRNDRVKLMNAIQKRLMNHFDDFVKDGNTAAYEICLQSKDLYKFLDELEIKSGGNLVFIDDDIIRELTEVIDLELDVLQDDLSGGYEAPYYVADIEFRYFIISQEIEALTRIRENLTSKKKEKFCPHESDVDQCEDCLFDGQYHKVDGKCVRKDEI